MEASRASIPLSAGTEQLCGPAQERAALWTHSGQRTSLDQLVKSLPVPVCAPPPPHQTHDCITLIWLKNFTTVTRMKTNIIINYQT